MRIRSPMLLLLVASGALALALLLLRGGGSRHDGPAVPFTGQKAVAVVDVIGVITSARGSGDKAVSGRRVAEQIDKHAGQDSVGAIVLRIDSPGGTVVGSQEIHAAVGRARAAGKPVVASMGDLAASGGYYAACGAERVFAAPGTMTGSIGVIMQFADVRGLMGKIGVGTSTIKSGEFKDIGNGFREMTERDRGVLQEIVDDVYAQFVEAVAAGRDMPVESVRTLADGRIYSGRQALGLGLVDELGDMEDAVAAAGRLAGIEGKPRIIHEKPKRRIWELLEGRVDAVLGLVPGLGAAPGTRLLYLWQ